MGVQLKIEALFDQDTFTLTYIVWDEQTKDALIIDPVLNYDQASSTYSFESVDEAEKFVKNEKLKVHFVMETHAHADHLSGSQELKRRLGNAKIVIGTEISKVQKTFVKILNLPDSFATDGSQFDLLLSDGQKIDAGVLQIEAFHTPGHTEACYSYKIEDVVFTGDALFMPDFGVGRCDFPQGSAKQLYKSIKAKIYTLPDSTRLFTAHDYQPGGRPLKFQSTVGEQKRCNIQLKDTTTENEFVEFRTNRDKKLSAPKLLLPSIQINIDAGRIPEPEKNKVSYIKLPITKKNSE